MALEQGSLGPLCQDPDTTSLWRELEGNTNTNCVFLGMSIPQTSQGSALLGTVQLTNIQSTSLTMPRRELRNLAIDGTEALIDGYRDEGEGLVYYYQGAYYEHDGTQEATEWAHRDQLMRRLPAGYFHLKAIVGEQTVHGQLQYLANWARYDELTWEPASAFRADDTAAWQAEKARLAEVEANAGDDDSEAEDNVEGNTEDALGQGNTSTADSDEKTKDNDEETNVNDQDSAGEVMMETAELAANEQGSNAGHERQLTPTDQQISRSRALDDDDADDVYADCDDPFGADAVNTHGDAKRCRSGRHPEEVVYTCSACRDLAFASLMPDQRAAYVSGADTILCWPCGEFSVESIAAFPCKCAVETQCGSCLVNAAHRLAEALTSVPNLTGEDACADCSRELEGGKRVSRCLACGGLKMQAY